MSDNEEEWRTEWRSVAAVAPEFVQWIVQTYGPLPEYVDADKYDQYREAYMYYLGG